MADEKANPADIAKAEAQRQQAALDDIIAMQHDESEKHRRCELAALYRVQIEVARAAWKNYRELQNIGGTK